MAVERVKLKYAFQILHQGPCPERGPPEFPEHRMITNLTYFYLVIKHLMLTNRYKQIYGIKILIHITIFSLLINIIFTADMFALK